MPPPPTHTHTHPVKLKKNTENMENPILDFFFLDPRTFPLNSLHLINAG